MAELSTIARPYAKALFELCHESGTLDAGAKAIEALAAVVGHPQVADLIGHPAVDDASLIALVEAACGDDLGEQGANLLKLLVANDRLAAAPAMAVQFAELKAEAEKRIDVQVTSAKPMSDDARTALVGSLSKRLGRTVELQVDTDESLIGGAIIRAGDLVIDGSVKGRLAGITRALTA